MELGALLPLGDIGGDPATVREYARTAEAIGYGFVEAPDHVLGASEASASEAGRTGAGLYHDPFVLFGYLAGCTNKLGFSTGVLILPQRQNRPRRESGGFARRAVRRSVPARHRGRLERGRVHRPQRELFQPRSAVC